MMDSLARRFARALRVTASWGLAIMLAMWCFAWITRWYVVVPILLLAVATIGRREPARPAPRALPVPRPREPEIPVIAKTLTPLGAEKSS
jgi:hypothetical protein